MMRKTPQAVSAVLELPTIWAKDVSLVPFLPAWVPMAWEWLNEDQNANMDDYGPKTLAEFSADLLKRHTAGQVIIGVRHGGTPVGIIGFQPVTPWLGHFTGICFAKAVHGKGVAFEAIQSLLKALWLDGYQKVEAQFFADNLRIARLFSKLGAHDEGMRYGHTLRGGRPVDLKLMGFCRLRKF